MADDILARTDALLEGVTEGAWLHREDPCGCYSVDAKPDLVCLPIAESIRSEADARFIAASRTLVPELLAEVERLRSYKSLPGGMVWQDYASPDDVCKIREPLDAEIERLRAELATVRVELATVRSGAQTLGRIVDRQAQDVLDIVGRDEVVGKFIDPVTFDGDWGLVWEMLAALRPARDEARAEVERLRGALNGLVSQWKAIAAVEVGGGYGAALEDNIAAIEDVLRGDQ